MDHSINSILCLLHRPPNCDTHGHFCLIFGNIAILTNSSTLISKITVAKLKLVLRWSLGHFLMTSLSKKGVFFPFPILNLIDPEMVSKGSTYILKTI